MQTAAYFENIQPKLVNELQRAEHTIYVAVAWFTDLDLFNILCQKLEKGVIVSILILDDEINDGDYALDFNRLKQKGAIIYKMGNKREVMHNKFCVIDHKTVITGSYNWTNKAKNNDENIIIIKDNIGLATEFIAEFYKLYKKCIRNTDIASSIKLLKAVKNEAELQAISREFSFEEALATV